MTALAVDPNRNAMPLVNRLLKHLRDFGFASVRYKKLRFDPAAKHLVLSPQFTIENANRYMSKALTTNVGQEVPKSCTVGVRSNRFHVAQQRPLTANYVSWANKCLPPRLRDRSSPVPTFCSTAWRPETLCKRRYSETARRCPGSRRRCSTRSARGVGSGQSANRSRSAAECFAFRVPPMPVVRSR